MEKIKSQARHWVLSSGDDEFFGSQNVDRGTNHVNLQHYGLDVPSRTMDCKLGINMTTIRGRFSAMTGDHTALVSMTQQLYSCALSESRSDPKDEAIFVCCTHRDIPAGNMDTAHTQPLEVSIGTLFYLLIGTACTLYPVPPSLSLNGHCDWQSVYRESGLCSCAIRVL